MYQFSTRPLPLNSVCSAFKVILLGRGNMFSCLGRDTRSCVWLFSITGNLDSSIFILQSRKLSKQNIKSPSATISQNLGWTIRELSADEEAVLWSIAAFWKMMERGSVCVNDEYLPAISISLSLNSIISMNWLTQPCKHDERFSPLPYAKETPSPEGTHSCGANVTGISCFEKASLNFEITSNVSVERNIMGGRGKAWCLLYPEIKSVIFDIHRSKSEMALFLFLKSPCSPFPARTWRPNIVWSEKLWACRKFWTRPRNRNKARSCRYISKSDWTLP